MPMLMTWLSVSFAEIPADQILRTSSTPITERFVVSAAKPFSAGQSGKTVRMSAKVRPTDVTSTLEVELSASNVVTPRFVQLHP